MSYMYTLNERGEPVAESDPNKWADWYARSQQTKERIVARQTIGNSDVSTVFLGTDHSCNEAAPILWETMVFGGDLDDEVDRCAGSREQAEAMHARMVARVRGSEPANNPLTGHE